MSGDPLNVCEHREWTTRKIDTHLSGGHLRDRMADMADDTEEFTVAQFDEIMKELKGIRGLLKDDGDVSVFWNTHWTRQIAKGLEDRLDRLEKALEVDTPGPTG